MSKSVFISYSTEDTPIAEQIRDGLEASGIPCWMAPRDIAPGLDYGGQIIDAIENCRVFLLVLSESANRSRFVLNEVERAVSKDKIVIPVRIADVTPSRSLEFFVSNAQWVDALAGIEGAVAALIGAIAPSVEPPGQVVEARQDDGVPPPAFRHNLPAPATPFVGREQELAEVVSLLAQADARLVTILGPGGMGKTRLAIESARPHAGSHGDAVVFVALAPLTESEAVENALAVALNYTFQAGPRPPRQQLVDFLRGREMLLVLDNFEHVMGAAGMVADILQAAPQVRILVTSRERLRLSGEMVYPLKGMDSPEDEAAVDAEQSAGVRLFVQGARFAQPDFALASQDIVHVVRICRLVQGLPLAILMAAAWVEGLSVGEISQEIDRNLDFLESDLRDVPERQRSMRAVFDYSWQLLGEAEQRAFARLVVFQGRFSRQAAQSVCDVSLRTLTGLAGKSLLHSTGDGHYEGHQVLGQYAAEKLSQDSAQEQALREGHAAYFLTSTAGRLDDLWGPRMQATMAEIEQELEDVQSAWRWATTNRVVNLLREALEALCRFYLLRGRYRDGRAASQAAASAAVPDDLLLAIQAHIWEAIFLRELVRPQEALALLGQAESRLAGLSRHDRETRKAQAYLHHVYGLLVGDTLDGPAARRHFNNAIAEYEALGERGFAAEAMMGLSYVMRNAGEVSTVARRQEQMAEIESILRRSLSICREIDHAGGVARSLVELGWNHYYQLRTEEAREAIVESLHLSEALRLENLVAGSHFRLAVAMISWGQYTEARVRLEMAQAYYERIGHGVMVLLFLTAYRGLLHLTGGDFARARQILLETSAEFRTLGMPGEAALSLCWLGYAEYALGDHGSAQRHLAESLELSVAAGSWNPMRYGVGLWTLRLAERGDAARVLDMYALFAAHTGWPAVREDLVERHLSVELRQQVRAVSAADRERAANRNLLAEARAILTEIQEAGE